MCDEGWFWLIALDETHTSIGFVANPGLAKQVGVRGMFSDWPATTTFYASCMGMK